MNTLHITEAQTVQMPMVRHSAEVGWVLLPPQDAVIGGGKLDWVGGLTD